MKIAIIGYSGAGKSTLARRLGTLYGCEVLHLDRIHFASGWAERTDDEMREDVGRFLEKESWVIDGNYSRAFYQRRLEEADQIVFLNFNRFFCLWRAYRRYRIYRGKTRPDMADGCAEKFDREFVRWILWGGRSRKARKRYRGILAAYPKKSVELKNQTQLDRFWEQQNKTVSRAGPGLTEGEVFFDEIRYGSEPRQDAVPKKTDDAQEAQK